MMDLSKKQNRLKIIKDLDSETAKARKAMVFKIKRSSRW